MAQPPATDTPAANGSAVTSRGLEGVVALESQLSFIDGQEGTLLYRGYDIADLAANASFEETAYLLWNGEMPTQPQLDELTAQMQRHRAIPEAVVDHLRHHTPADANPMAALRTAVSMLAFFDEDAAADPTDREATYRTAIRLTAQTPTVVAAFDRIRKGLDPIAPTGEGSTAYDFLYCLNGEAPGERAEEILDAALVLHADHGLNASTFTARVIGATLSDMYSAVTGAIGALKGPLHGGANIKVMEMLKEIDETDQTTEGFVRDALANKRRIMGMGHRVYKTLDPRARILGGMLKGLSEEKGDMKWYEMSTDIQRVVHEEKGLNPNVDFFSASVYYLLGIESDLYTPIFAMSRMVGWTANLLEQWEANRLIRPRAAYVGPKGKTIRPIGER